MRPARRSRSPSYAPELPNWPDDLELKIAVIADIHACYPWMSEERVGEIVDLANAQKPDLTVLLGDYVCTHRFVSGYVPPGAWAEQLARLEAPLGVYAILGNHDWWSAAIPTEPPDNSLSVRRALAAAGVPLLENQSVRLSQRGRPFWLIGLGDLLAPVPNPRRGHGADDLPGGDARDRRRRAGDPARSRALFLSVGSRPDRSDARRPHARRAGQSSDHRPSGVSLLKRRSGKYIYGEYALGERRMIVSGGLGTSLAPVRILRPPEVVMVKLGGDGGLA